MSAKSNCSIKPVKRHEPCVGYNLKQCCTENLETLLRTPVDKKMGRERSQALDLDRAQYSGQMRKGLGGFPFMA